MEVIMKKKLLLFTTLLLSAYQTQTLMLAGIAVASSKSKKSKGKPAAPGQQFDLKVRKGYKAVATTNNVSVKQNPEKGSRHYIVTTKSSGQGIVEEIKDGIKSFKEGLEKELKTPKKNKQHLYNIASKNMPGQMTEGDTKYVVRKKDQKFKQTNLKDDQNGEPSHVKLKHTHTTKDRNGAQIPVLRVHAKDDGDKPAKVKNTNTGKVHNISVFDDE